MIKALVPVCLALSIAPAFAQTSPAVVPPDLVLTRVGTITHGPPAQLVMGPDGRLYVSLANFGRTEAPSVVSYRYDPAGQLTDEIVEASTGGAIGVGFGVVTLGPPGSRQEVGLYLTDTARRDVSNLRVLTRGTNGRFGIDGGINTVIVRNLPGGYHQVDQLVVRDQTTLYVGIGTRTSDGAEPYPRRGAGENAYGGTIGQIADLRRVNGLVEDAAGFGLDGKASSNADADYTNAGPFTSRDPGKLVVHSAGARNPFGLAFDGNGDLWFTNNFSTTQADGTFDGAIDPRAYVLKGFELGDLSLPHPNAPDLRTHVHDQLFKAVPFGDYGSNNLNWRTDANRSNPRATSTAAVDAGFFDFMRRGVRSSTFDNLTRAERALTPYDQSNPNRIIGLGPGSAATGLAFYTGTAFPAHYRGLVFIARWAGTTTDSAGRSVTYRDVVAVDIRTGVGRQTAKDFEAPIDVIEDGHGNLLIADHGARAIYRLMPRVAGRR